MRVHYLQHVPFVCLGSIETWLLAAGHELRGTRFFLNEPLPTIDDFDCLIVLGGPMSVHDEERLPWLIPEKKLIRQSIDAGKRILGICLGAQLIALVMGAPVYPNPEREIGWFPIHRTPEAAGHPFGDVIPNQVDVFHWHGDTFDLPPRAILLASSEACQNQAYAIGDHVLAFQFHLEPFITGAKSLIVECQDELIPSPHIQTPAEMLANPERFDGINRMMDLVLRQVVAELPASPAVLGNLTTEVSETRRTPFWGMAKKALGDASTRVSTAGVAVASKAASLGSSGAVKAAELGKQTYIAAGNAAEASGATQAIKATAGAVAGKLDEVSGKRLVELLEQKLRVQDSYNDILATRLADALERISILESRINVLTSQSQASAIGTEVRDEYR